MQVYIQSLKEVKTTISKIQRAVIISTSHSILSKPGETDGKLTGVFASELTVPYYEFIRFRN